MRDDDPLLTLTTGLNCEKMVESFKGFKTGFCFLYSV